MVTIAQAAASIKSAPLAVFSDGLIDQLCRDCRHEFRSSPLDPANTIATFMQQILAGNVSLAETVRITGSKVTPQAYCAARQRLPLDVIGGLVDDLHQRFLPQTRTRSHLWKGHRLFLADGSTASMSDTPDLRDHFGTPSGQAPGCGFPVAHLLTMFCASTGLLLGTWTSPMNTSDMAHMDEAHCLAEAGDILIADDSFSGYPHLAAIAERGLHCIFPVHHLRIVDFRLHRRYSPQGKNAIKGMTRSKWICSLGTCDQIVEYYKPNACPKRMSQEQFDALPDSIRVREIKRRVRRETGERVTVTIMTTLLDAKKYPADEIIRLRLIRWEVETNLGHLKTTMHLDVLRSRSVEGVRKEIAMIGLVYNLVRVVMLEAARRQAVKPNRISFKDAYQWMRHAQPGECLPKLTVNPHRPDRVEPRCKKRRAKQYDLMNRPRSELRKRLKTQAKRV